MSDMNRLGLRYRLRIRWHLILALFWIGDEDRCGRHLDAAMQEITFATNQVPEFERPTPTTEGPDE